MKKPLSGKTSLWGKPGEQEMIRNVRVLRKTPHLLSAKMTGFGEEKLYSSRLFRKLHGTKYLTGKKLDQPV